MLSKTLVLFASKEKHFIHLLSAYCLNLFKMSERLRRRVVADGNTEYYRDDLYIFNGDLDGKITTSEHAGLSYYHCIVVITFHVLIFSLAIYAHHYVPTTRLTEDKSEFAEWRARAHLHEITSYGRRPTGSYANENQTVDFLLRTLSSIRDSSSDDVILDIDVQRPSGSFTIDFLEGFTSYYRNLTNVVARVSSKKNYPAKHSILVNAHFDSSFGGAGASDDAVSCAAMLEVIRCLTVSPNNQLEHSLVFLFNGAEENFLQGSHGFITQHPWAGDVRVFINLEAAGAGGRELVFQTGPEHPWMIKMYANSANYPYASIIGQELFQTGLIPADTDFRIFRDYGNIPGIDIAYVSNGYVYHTRRDLPDAITPGSIQRAGENLLEMVKQLSESPLVADPSGDRHGAMVFYDFLGLFLVIYPQRLGLILNTLVAIVTFACIGLKLSKRSGNGGAAKPNVMNGRNLIRNLSLAAFVKALFVVLISWLISLTFVFAIAQLITASGHSLSWYCKPYLIIGLYVLPGILAMAAVHQMVKIQNKYSWTSRWEQETHVFYAILFLWNLLLSITTYYNLGSAFLPMLLVAFPLFGRVFLWEICFGYDNSVDGPKNCNRFVSMYLITITIPVLLCSYILWMHIEFLVPILGRSGSNDPPDLLVSMFVSFSALVIVSYSLSLIYLVSRVKLIALALSGIWLTSLVLVFLGIAFPYSAQPWCPKRIIFQHTSRTLHDADGQVRHQDSGLWVVPFDYLGVQYLEHLPEFEKAVIPDMDQGLFGDFPYYVPCNFLYDKTWYIPGPTPQLSTISTVKLVSRENRAGGYSRLNFEMDGPSHMSLFVSPKPGVQLVSSSLGDLYQRYIPRKGFGPREEYFVYYSHGVYTGPWSFWIELQPSTSSKTLVDIGVAGHYSDGKDSQSTFMSEFINKLPDWVDAAAWVSSYEKWTF